MNSSIGASTHRYFTLLGSELSYYKLPPDGHEVQITSLSPYVANPNSKHFASNDDSNTLKTVQLLRNTVVSKQTTQLFKPCYCLETSGGTIRMIAEEEEDNQAWVDAIEYNSRYLQQQEKLEQSSVYAPLKTSAPDVGTRIESIEHTKHEYFHHDTGHYRCVCIDVCGDVHCGVYEYLHKGDVQYCLEYSQIGTKSPSTTRFQISCVHKTNSNLDCKLLQLCMYSEDIVIVGGEHGYVALGQVNTYFQSKDQLSLPCLSLLPPGDSASSGNNGNLGSVSAISVCRERHLFVVGDAKGGFALYRVGEVPATASLSYRLQSQFNVNTLKDNSKKRYGPRLFMEESDSDSIVALQFVYRGLYVLVTTSSGRVLLIGLSFEAGEDLTSDAGASRDISVTTWSTVDLFSLSASTSSGPPRGLAAMAMPRGSNGVGIAGGNNCDSRIRYIMSIEPYQEMDDVTSDMHTRQRIILYKIFVSATMEGHVECVRQAISEAVLQKAIAKSECLLV